MRRWSVLAVLVVIGCASERTETSDAMGGDSTASTDDPMVCGAFRAGDPCDTPGGALGLCMCGGDYGYPVGRTVCCGADGAALISPCSEWVYDCGVLVPDAGVDAPDADGRDATTDADG